MRFFIPAANDFRQSEDVYRVIRDRVTDVSGGVSEGRIYHLKFRLNGHPQTAAVGSDRHGFGKGAVLAIFEGLDGLFYVCTQGSHIADTHLHAVHHGAVIETTPFSAEAQFKLIATGEIHNGSN